MKDSTLNPAVMSEVQARGISEVLHFTTNLGLTGVCASREVKSRAMLSEDQYLAKIITPNASYRRDLDWLNYVNLSISRVNRQFFDVSVRKWHAGEDLWWCILSFDATILGHKGVIFTTTNNIYTGVSRSEGVGGLQAMFASRVHRYSQNYVRRTRQHKLHYTTCEQAEVLYPNRVPTDLLRKVYVRTDEHAASAEGMVAASDHARIPVVVAPEMF